MKGSLSILLPVLVAFLLCCTCQTSGSSGCHHDGPENCTFQWTDFKNHAVCSWSLENFRASGSSQDNLSYSMLIRGKEQGKLTSRLACSTEGQTHCLRFAYKFVRNNNNIDLSVSIRYEGDDEARPPLWNISSSEDWENATVPVDTTKDFIVAFIAKRRPGGDVLASVASVFLDNIFYSKSPCPVGLYPPEAKPSSPATTHTQSTTTATIKLAVTTDPTTLPPGPASTATSTTTVTAAGLEDSKADTLVQPPESSAAKEAGVIAAVVSIVVVIVIVVLVLVIRRRHCRSWAPFARNGQLTERLQTNAYFSAAYGLDTYDVGHPNGDVMG